MPGLVRKLVIYASAQGLLLIPLGSRSQVSTAQPLQIEYGSHDISSALRKQEEDKAGAGLESHGILGLLNFASTAFLVSIARREQIAQVRGKAVFVITDVHFIPLSSQADAQKSIDEIRSTRSRKRASRSSATDTDDDTDASVSGTDDEHDTNPATPAVEPPGAAGARKGLGPLGKGTSVAADVIVDRGKYGRFAERWFSKAGWSANGRAKQGMSSTSQEDLTREQKRQGLNALPNEQVDRDVPKDLRSDGEDNDAHSPEPSNAEHTRAEGDKSSTHSIVVTLAPRIIKTLRVFLSSRSFYFSYEHDLSRRLATQDLSSSELPLHKRFDSRYFWNQHLLQPFINGDQQQFILPVIQGFVGQRVFTVGKNSKDENDKIVDAINDPSEMIELWERTLPVPLSPRPESPQKAPSKDSDDTSKDFMLTLISRRSIKRAGLRYLRRGVDDTGNVANNVETEQILSDPSWSVDEKVFSLLQIRGSIPLFFSQSPYSFKPVPITYGSEATTHLAFNKHFDSLIKTYGKVHAASLVDKHATEKSIGELYQHHVDMTNEGQNPSHGFPGPSAETTSNRAVSPHVTRQDPRHIAFTWFDFHHECRAMNFQNVLYLLDLLSKSLTDYGWTESINSRITTVQSGVIRTNCMDCLDRTNVVQSAIAGQILTQQLSTYGLSIDLSSDPRTQWFNTLWADNGDAISRQYAGTAALKGDFTRTRKRHWTGALNDFSLTLGRYYNNIFSDYFLQTTIDYMLGLGDETMWEEFESELMTSDYALDMQRVRQEAVERSVRVVLGRGAEAFDMNGGLDRHVVDDNAEAQASEEKRDSTSNRDQTLDLSRQPTNTGRSRDFEDEDLISGWTLHTPSQPNTLKSQPLEECVLLLTDTALYAVRFDWKTEKVGSYERVALTDITGMKRGVYITSTLGTKNTDEERNVGFVITFKQRADSGARRVNTRSLQTDVTSKSTDENEDATTSDGGADETEGQATAEKDFASQTPADAQQILDEAAAQPQNDTKAAAHDATDGTPSAQTESDTEAKAEPRLLAFKSLSPRSTATARSEAQSAPQQTSPSSSTTQQQQGSGLGSAGSAAGKTGPAGEMREADVVRLVTEEIYRAVVAARKGQGVNGETPPEPATGASASNKDESGDEGHGGAAGGQGGADGGNGDGHGFWVVREEPVISVEEARRSTGYFESIGYSLRRLVWS